MTQNEKYDLLHRNLAKKYRTSHLIIQTIRTAYSEYKDLSVSEYTKELKKKFEKKIVSANEVLRSQKLDMIRDIAFRERGLRGDYMRNERLKEGLPLLIKAIETMSFHVSLVEFLKRYNEIVISEILEAKLDIIENKLDEPII